MSLLEKIVRNPVEYKLIIDSEIVNEIPKDACELITTRTKTDSESIVYIGSFPIPNKYEKCNLDVYWVYHGEDPIAIFGIERYGNKSNNINSLYMNKYEFKK